MGLPDLARDAAARFALAPGARLVVGASGGVDSTVLLRLLHEGGFAVAAAHVDYGLRGAASDADEAFVRALAAELGVPVHVRRAALPEGGNRQAAARAARYAFFGEVAAAEGAGVVAVGHTRDDQAETVLLNLCRGAGLRGLAGMATARPLARGSDVRLIRPLLETPRAEVEALARARGWAWREDASNATDAYRRNALRRRVVPALRDAFGPGVDARIAAAAAHVRAFLGDPASPPALLTQAATAEGRLALAGLRALDGPVRRAVLLEALRAWAPGAPRHTAAAAALERLLDAQPGRRVRWPGLTVWRDRDALVFETGEAPPAAEVWPVTVGAPVETPSGTLLVAPLDAVPAAFPASPDEEVADADALGGPLVLRPWRAGDRLRPLGLDGTRLVSDLLTEARVPPSERAGRLVLCAGEAVVWVVGVRLADAVRVRPETRRAVRLLWRPRDTETPPPR